MDIGKGISQSFDLYMKNIGILIVAGLVAMLLSFCTAMIIAGPIYAGLLILCTKLLRGESGEVGELFAHFDKFVPTLILSLIIFVPACIVAIIPILGTLVLIVAGPALSMIWMFGILEIVNNNLAPMDALKKGLELFQKNMVMNWLYSLVIGIIAGLCAFITLPIGAIGMVIAYQELTGGTQAPPSDVAPSV